MVSCFAEIRSVRKPWTIVRRFLSAPINSHWKVLRRNKYTNVFCNSADCTVVAQCTKEACSMCGILVLLKKAALFQVVAKFLKSAPP